MQKEDFRDEELAPEDNLEFNDDEALDVADLEDLSEGVEYDDDGDDDLEVADEYDDDDDDDDELDDGDDEFLGALAGVAAPALIGGLAGPAVRGIGRLLGGRSRRKRRFRYYNPIRVGGGVRGATVRTPRGVARLKLPTSVVPMSTYRRDIARLNSRDNSLTRRINQTQSDLAKTEKKSSQALSLAGQNTARIGRVEKKHGRSIRRMRRYQKVQIAKLKKEQSEQNTMNMLLSMMQVQGLETALRSHTHSAVGAAPVGISQSNSAMMLLPLMMSDGGGDNDMMMIMLMMQMMNQQPAASS